MDGAKGVWFKSLRLGAELCKGSVVVDTVEEAKAPNGSDPSKLFNGIAAKGSKVSVFAGSEMEVFVSKDKFEFGAALNSVFEGNAAGKEG